MPLGARFYGQGKPLKVEEVDMPKPGPDDALVMVKAASVCHSDLYFIDSGSPMLSPGRVMGHGFAGQVEEVGSNAHELATKGIGLRCIF